MSDIRTLLIRGSEKVIAHFHVLLRGAKTERERELYLERIEREQRLLERLKDGVQSRIAA